MQTNLHYIVGRRRQLVKVCLITLLLWVEQKFRIVSFRIEEKISFFLFGGRLIGWHRFKKLAFSEGLFPLGTNLCMCHVLIKPGRAGQGRDNENSLWAPGIHGPVKKLKIEKN